MYRTLITTLSLLILSACRSGAMPAGMNMEDTGSVSVDPTPTGVDWTNSDLDGDGVNDNDAGYAEFTTESGAFVVLISPDQCDYGRVPGAGYGDRGERIDPDTETVTYAWEGNGLTPVFQVDNEGDGIVDRMGVVLPGPGIYRQTFALPSATSALDSPGWCKHDTNVSAEAREDHVLTFTQCDGQVAVNLISAVDRDGYWWNAKTDAAASIQERSDCD